MSESVLETEALAHERRKFEANALDCAADALAALKPEELIARAPKIEAIIRNGSAWLREAQETIARLRQQNHDFAARMQTKYEREISEMRLRLIPDRLEKEQRERVRAFLLENANNRWGEAERLQACGLSGYNGNEQDAVMEAFSMVDEARREADVLRERVKEAESERDAARLRERVQAKLTLPIDVTPLIEQARREMEPPDDERDVDDDKEPTDSEPVRR